MKQKRYTDLIRIRDPLFLKYRIFKFKRPKWKLLKKILISKFFKQKKKYNKRYRFKIRRGKQLVYINQIKRNVPLNWTYLKHRYREALLAKIRFFLFFNIKARLSTIKRELIRSKQPKNFLINIEQRLDVILWRTKIFQSPAIARFYINHKNVFVNEKINNNNNYKLKMGDCVSFTKTIQEQIKLNFFKKKKREKIWLMIPYYLNIDWNILKIHVLPILSNAPDKYINGLYNTNLYLTKVKTYLIKN